MSKKNSNVLNLSIQKKVDKKILEIYSNFKKNISNIRNKNFIVAVSGGPDSLALSILMKQFQSDYNSRVFYVLVDHNLRKGSAAEAIKVKKILNKKGIKINILINKKLFNSNIQAQARNTRYKLLSNFAIKKKIKYIITAHHSDDQIETFLIRLSRGSGVQGLSAMKLKTKLDNKIILLRPLLKFKKKELTLISKKFFGKAIKDPSNKNTKFLRTRIRKLKKSIEKAGIHHDQIIKSIQNLASTNETLNIIFNKIYKLNVQKYKNQFKVNYKNILQENLEIQLKLFSQVIKEASKRYYPPRSKKVLNLIKKINVANNSKYSLSGLEILRKGDYITIKKNA